MGILKPSITVSALRIYLLFRFIVLTCKDLRKLDSKFSVGFSAIMGCSQYDTFKKELSNISTCTYAN